MGLLNADLIVDLLAAEHASHRAIANNLANVDTPGYRTMRVRFADALDGLVTDKGNLRKGKSITTETYSPMFGSVSADGNDVTLDREIVELNKNQLRMELYLSVLSGRISKMRMAIEGK
jgi:flagellar basal-body rod protein FlgB